MSFTRFVPGLPRDHPDRDPGRDRPEEAVRRNAAGEAFHTYVDPDAWPAMALADELRWRLDHRDED